MMTKKIVLLAHTGQVGFELHRQLQSLGSIITVSRGDVDFSDSEAVYNHIDAMAPDIIVNAAAYTAVDKAETDERNALALNRDLPQTLAKLSVAHDALLVHYSSDYVYPGNGETPWREDDSTSPQNLYGQSKLEGDLAIERTATKFLIFRTSWVYAARGNNFLRSMLRLGQEREGLNIVNDQIGAPTPARLIATVTLLCIQRILVSNKAQELSGVYHLAPSGYTSWYGFAKTIFEGARSKGIELALKEEGLGQIESSEYPTPAARPLNSRLSLDKIESAFGLSMPTWQSQLALTLDEWLEMNQS
ncbi:dTDP-4-dehydrorhamnose reductase [Psychrobacter sp.]|uniref:dTDP-4-dehydrorhamnose reductase n=1 Tax=Psychrobacter sp. TaxID=56811 RepID=UPI003C722395|tara:strand:- start:11772 stop:12683 length:912 start_codon:yes stop_codon:yes gene_type:complete